MQNWITTTTKKWIIKNVDKEKVIILEKKDLNR